MTALRASIWEGQAYGWQQAFPHDSLHWEERRVQVPLDAAVSAGVSLKFIVSMNLLSLVYQWSLQKCVGPISLNYRPMGQQECKLK